MYDYKCVSFSLLGIGTAPSNLGDSVNHDCFFLFVTFPSLGIPWKKSCSLSTWIVLWFKCLSFNRGKEADSSKIFPLSFSNYAGRKQVLSKLASQFWSLGWGERKEIGWVVSWPRRVGWMVGYMQSRKSPSPLRLAKRRQKTGKSFFKVVFDVCMCLGSMPFKSDKVWLHQCSFLALNILYNNDAFTSSEHMCELLCQGEEMSTRDICQCG